MVAVALCAAQLRSPVPFCTDLVVEYGDLGIDPLNLSAIHWITGIQSSSSCNRYHEHYEGLLLCLSSVAGLLSVGGSIAMSHAISVGHSRK
jgi:hypothetical protein